MIKVKSSARRVTKSQKHDIWRAHAELRLRPIQREDRSSRNGEACGAPCFDDFHLAGEVSTVFSNAAFLLVINSITLVAQALTQTRVAPLWPRTLYSSCKRLGREESMKRMPAFVVQKYSSGTCHKRGIVSCRVITNYDCMA